MRIPEERCVSTKRRHSDEEAGLLAEVRLEIAEILGIIIGYTEPDAIRDRFSELFEEKARRDEEKKQAEARKALRVA